HRPRKHDVGSERLKQLRTHPRDTVEPRQPAERTVLLPPRDDPLRERGPDSRETRDLRHVGAVEVDALTGEQRPRQPGGGPGGGGEPSRRRVYGHQPHVAGRRGRGGGEGQTHTRAGEREQGEQQRGATVVHDRTLAVPLPGNGIRSTRGAPEECETRKLERGTR